MSEQRGTGIRPAPSGRELKVIEFMAALDAQLQGHQTALRERLKLIPNGWRQWRLISVTVGNLLCALYDTLPNKSMEHMRHLCKHGEILIRLNKPVVREPGQLIASEDDLREVINAAMASECTMCIKDAREIKACKLRRAMMGIIPPEDLPPTGCGYRDIVHESEYGDYA